MKRGIILAILVLLILAITFSFIFFRKSPTGYAIENSYTYTKAICNETNFCQDYEIKCRENETISTTPISGAVIQRDKDWQDPRNEKTRNKMCE